MFKDIINKLVDHTFKTNMVTTLTTTVKNPHCPLKTPTNDPTCIQVTNGFLITGCPHLQATKNGKKYCLLTIEILLTKAIKQINEEKET